jgi:hypothetical protein
MAEINKSTTPFYTYSYVLTLSLILFSCGEYEDLDPIPANTSSVTFGIRHAFQNVLDRKVDGIKSSSK